MAKDFQRLWKDIRNSNDEAMAIRTLASIVGDREGRAFILNLDCQDAEYCIDMLDRGITQYSLNTSEKQAFFVMLRRLTGFYGRLPDSMMVAGDIEIGNDLLASGGFADVRLGKYMERLVAVKTLRVMGQEDLHKIRKQFCKEAVLWRTLSHPHVLKLVGVYGDMQKGEFTTVSEWMAHGNVMDYIKKNHANRLELLHGAAQGLNHLHSSGFVHGDLKGANILMSNDTPPRACLADFGFMAMVLDPIQPMSCSAQLEGGTLTFMSPELLLPSAFGIKNPVPTPQADIYAFGLVILQVLTGELPFRGIRTTELGFSVLQGLRPDRPANSLAIGLSDSLWSVVQHCWDRNMNFRPKVAEVVTHLEKATVSWQGLMPPCNQVEDVTCTSEVLISGSMQRCEIFDRPTESPETKATSALATLQFELGTSMLKPQEESHYNRADSDPLQNNQSTASRPPPARKTRIFSKIFSMIIPYRKTKNDVSSALKLSGHLSLDIAGIVSESKRKPSQELIDRIDKILENTLYDHDRCQLLSTLCKLCTRLRSIPKAMFIDTCLDGDFIQECGQNGTTVFRREYKGRAVAMKMLRLYLTSNLDKCVKKFFQEAVAWRHLRHPNILPLLGINLDPEKRRFALVSEWMVHGNINEFLRMSKGINRVQLLVDATNGLEYMHSLNIVHGDLKGANILINNGCRACLADFGLSTICSVGHRALAGLPSTASKESLMLFTAGGTTRWMSPELLHPEQFGHSDDRPTKQSDCYALGMVVYEVLCGKHPYWEITSEALVTLSIMEGERPKRPEVAESLGFTDGLRGVITECWSVDTNARPDVKIVLSHLNHATWFWERRRLT